MMNSTQVSYFTLGAYIDEKLFRYLFFTILLVLYVLIIGSNVLLIVLICVNRSLHEPMFLFLCSLLGLFPFLLVQILSDVHIIPAPLCLLQIFFLYTYGSVEFANLAVMSYDRYVAICRPLQYNSLMTAQRIVFLVSIIWLPPLFCVGFTVFLSSSLQLCGNVINKVYCDNHSIIKLACNDPTANNIYELIMAFLTVCVPVSVILYTYLRILQVCFSGSKQTRQKAVSTCTPHLASVINFSFGVSFEILQSRFNMDTVPGLLRTIFPLYYLTCQPLFNPVLYGLNMSRIRKAQTTSSC
uniref:Olfactory receptor n=1 Tax=Poecilia latipinna TaxID=48699 RepID=A0A3B3UJ79_9TELE